jgi:hypothetical protein
MMRKRAGRLKREECQQLKTDAVWRWWWWGEGARSGSDRVGGMDGSKGGVALLAEEG